MGGRPLTRTVALLERGRGEGLHLGGQLYVSLGGEAVVELAVGEVRPGEPMTPDTLMIWLSATKPVAAVAVAQLWERGLLDLDDPVARHIPEFGARGKEGVTLRHLLTHTGGIRMVGIESSQATWEEILARIAASRLEPGWVPGRRAGYHLTSSWYLLAEVVARLDGRGYPRYVREAIFEPIGMADAWIGMPAERYRAYGARIGSMFNTEGPEPRRYPWDQEARVGRTNPGGGGWGPMRDLGRLYEMLLGRGSWRGARVLSPQAVEALTAVHRTGLVDRTFQAPLAWGLGFIPNPDTGQGEEIPPYGYGRHASRRAFGHSGFQSSTAFADPEHGLAVALVVNGTPGEDAHRRRFRALTEAIYEDLGLA